MTLFELSLFLLLGLIGFQFWRVRSISEFAYEQAQHYCETHQLQLLSVSRRKTRITGKYGKLDWFCEFEFEFSGNGEDKYSGTMELVGRTVIRTQLPPYRVH